MQLLYVVLILCWGTVDALLRSSWRRPSSTQSPLNILHATKSSRQTPTTPTPAVEAPSLTPYVGPVSTFEEMISGCTIDDLGLQVLLGPSCICDGLGLFVALSEDTESTVLTKGTPICGYSKGRLTDEADGTFTVAYAFFGLQNGVIFNKRLMPLMEAIGIAANMTGAQALKDLVAGHNLLWDAEAEEIIIEPTPDYPFRYFLPDDPFAAMEADKDISGDTYDANTSRPTLNVDKGEGVIGEYDQEELSIQESPVEPSWDIGNMGMYANDLAYSPTATVESYLRDSPEKNMLQIVWRMEMSSTGQLGPTWPVVILLRDVLLDSGSSSGRSSGSSSGSASSSRSTSGGGNRRPMEVGLQYSWKYWLAVKQLEAEAEAAAEAEQAEQAAGGAVAADEGAAQ